MEPKNDYDGIEITANIDNCHFKTTPGLLPQLLLRIDGSLIQ